MIKKLDHKIEIIAREIKDLFQVSYRIEADILQVEEDKFPPLNRKLPAFINSDSEFHGVIIDKKIVALVQLSFYESTIDIDSLIVHPDYFRRGLGRQLMHFVLNNFDTKVFTVETGLKNTPATTLYTQLGFQEIAQWDTDFGVRKIKFQWNRTEL